jgi:hypothetical protein
LYDNLTLKDVSGKLIVKDEKVTLENIKTYIFGCTIGLKGAVSNVYKDFKKVISAVKQLTELPTVAIRRTGNAIRRAIGLDGTRTIVKKQFYQGANSIYRKSKYKLGKTIGEGLYDRTYVKYSNVGQGLIGKLMKKITGKVDLGKMFKQIDAASAYMLDTLNLYPV